VTPVPLCYLASRPAQSAHPVAAMGNGSILGLHHQDKKGLRLALEHPYKEDLLRTLRAPFRATQSHRAAQSPLRPGASFPLTEHPARGSSPFCPRRAEPRPVNLIPQWTPVISLWLSPGQEKHGKWYRKKTGNGSAHRENVPAVVGSIDCNAV
jgi:hypothetical protein